MKFFHVDEEIKKLALRGFIFTFLYGSIGYGCINSFTFFFPSPSVIVSNFQQTGLLLIPMFLIGWLVLGMQAALAYCLFQFPFFFFSGLLTASFILAQRRLGFTQAMVSGTAVPLIYVLFKCFDKCQKTIDNLYSGIIDKHDAFQAVALLMVPAISWGIARLRKDSIVMGLQPKPVSTLPTPPAAI